MKHVMTVISLSLFFLISSQSQAACISNDEVTLKAKPSEKAKSTWVVGRYTPLLVGQRQGAWYQVSDLDGAQHWVHARHLTTQYECLIVRTPTANLRLGPGTQYPNTDLAFVKKYGIFKKVGRDEEWLKVQDEYGQSHWVHENTIWEPRVMRKVTF